MPNHLTWQLVDQVASDLAVTKAARLKWRRPDRGVPPEWQIKIVRELARRGIDVPLDAFANLEPNPGRIAA